jgi:para-aminobenzoate synthetase component 1
VIYSRFRWNKDKFLELSEAEVAFIYYRKTRMNLLTGYLESYHFQDFLQKLGSIPLQGRVKSPQVYHFYYELGLILAGLGHTVNDEAPLVIEIIYQKKKLRSHPKSKLKGINLLSLERPTWTEYKNAFQHIQEKLLAGDTYQVNLTYPFDFETKEVLDPRDILDFFFSQEGLGAYAHGTFLGDELILSNSPECLFQYRDDEIFTMPIKGTKIRKKDWHKDWKAMKKDPKERGELIMIADLLRNDLNRLEHPRAKVKKLQAPLLVPGLLHQYALLSVELENSISLLKVLECLFPGGSVTGAPKKKTMEILQDVERFQRGLYTGSTLLCYDDKKVASINIRTASISIGDRFWKYAAGGGITLLSKAVFEFQEMEAKVSSFLTLLKSSGYEKKK